MAGAGNGDDNTVVNFPTTAEERKLLRRAKQDAEKQRLINVFIDETGGDKALFRSPDGTAFADLIVAGHRETWPVRSRQFRHHYIVYLRRQFDQLVSANQPLMAMAMKSAMRRSAVSAAIDDFENRAICTDCVREVSVRVAGYDGEIYIDLCNAEWQAIRIISSRWSIVESPPVRFQRTDGMLPLPIPEHGGKIEALRPFLNTTASDFVLVVAWLLAALYPRGPYPIIALYGEQGTAKTTLLRRLRRLVDPHAVETTSLPPSGRDLFIHARNSRVLMFQNLSHLSDQMSDHLCRLADGGGFRLRKLFKDSDETLFRGGRPIGFEGIANVVTRPDLQERAIISQLENLPNYKTERELDDEFERQRPSILGALLDMIVRGLEMLPVTHLVSPPRMADFAYWGAACGVENFEAAYAANRQNAILVLLAHDPAAKAVRALMAGGKRWSGIMEQLLDIVGPTTGIKSTKKLSDDLRRLAPMLRTVGVDITYEQRTAEQRGLRIEQNDTNDATSQKTDFLS
jgi:hypothetical protein